MVLLDNAPAVPTRTLRHGAEIPTVGLGTSPLLGDDARDQVQTALQRGYRLIDTAENYHNEEGVGRGILESGVDRSAIFLTTKLNRRWHSVDGVREAHRTSLERLGLDSIDLLLIHWPNPDQGTYVEAVRGLEALRQEGLLRAIGTSNFKVSHLQRVFDETGIVPDVNQIQLSPYSTRDANRAYHDQQGIATESWSPIGAGSDELRSDPLIVELAEAYHVTATQVILRWHQQLGLISIPKSADPGRMTENISLFGFELDDADVERISGLDRGEDWITDSDEFGH